VDHSWWKVAVIKWGQIDFIHWNWFQNNQFINLKIRPYCFHHPLHVDTSFNDVDLFLNQGTITGYLGYRTTICKYSQIMCFSLCENFSLSTGHCDRQLPNFHLSQQLFTCRNNLRNFLPIATTSTYCHSL